MPDDDHQSLDLDHSEVAARPPAGPDESSPLTPGSQLDDFEIIEEIGRGGMGVVYKARQQSLNRVVALKFLSPAISADPATAKRFRKEAVLAANQSHPNIVPVFQIDGQTPARYFTMEYVAGKSLQDKLDREGYLAAEEAARIAWQACEALGHAHDHKIVHRDIKPGNILLENHLERVRITDFGIAQDVSGELIDRTVTGQATVGTPGWMSPEQVRGETLDERTDIFSLGATLYYMLTGQRPYRAETRTQLQAAFREQTPIPPSRFNGEVPAGLDRIVLKMVAADPNARYASAGALGDDLKAFLDGHHQPDTAVHKASRRRWRLYGFAAVVAVALAALGIVAARPWGQQPGRSPGGTGQTGGHHVAGAALPYELRVVGEIAMPGVVRNWPGALLGEWDADGEADLFVRNAGGTDLIVVSQQGQVLDQRRLLRGKAREISLGLLTDTDGDGKDEMFIDWAEGDDLAIAVLNQNFHELKRFAATGTVYNGPAGRGLPSRLSAVRLTDLDRDGRRELVAMVNTGYGNAPRGICCFDFETGELRWQYLTGAVPHGIGVADIDGDGDLDIAFGATAVANGHKAEDGTTDEQSYVCVVSGEGKLLWTTVLGGAHSETDLHVADVDGDGTNDVLAWVRGSPHWYAGPDPIVLLDSNGRIAHRHDPAARIVSCAPVDLDADGTPEILATDRRGDVLLFDAQLRLQTSVPVVQSPYGDVKLALSCACDLDADGRPELVMTVTEVETVSRTNPGFATGPRNVVVYHHNCVLVLDGDLKVIARHVLAEQWKEPVDTLAIAGPRLSPRAGRILVLADRAILLELYRK